VFLILVNRIPEPYYLDYAPVYFILAPYFSIETAYLKYVFNVDRDPSFYLLLVWTVHLMCVLGVRFLTAPVVAPLVYLELSSDLYCLVLSTCYREPVVYFFR
jgi:hypothetical protein